MLLVLRPASRLLCFSPVRDGGMYSYIHTFIHSYSTDNTAYEESCVLLYIETVVC